MSACDEAHSCITCSDAAVAMSVASVDASAGLAACVDAGGARQTVDTALVDPVAVGDALLVHAGVALARLEGPV